MTTNKKVNWIDTHSDGQKRINSQLLYKHLKETLPLKITDKGNFYLYEGKVYRRVSQKEFKSIIKNCLPIEYRKAKDWETVWKEFNTDKPDIKESQLDANENIIGFENGILNIKNGEMMKFSKKHLLTRLVQCNYLPNKNLSEAPVFFKYLQKLCNSNQENMNFLLEFIGAVLSNVQGWRFKKLLIIVGAGNTGKTQIREFTLKILGEEASVSIDLKKINERFGSAQLYKKRLAGSGDMSAGGIAELNTIKNLTGGDSLFAEFKGKDGFSFRYDGLLWFNANSLPSFSGDRGQHVYDRIAIIKCNNVIPVEERNSHLQTKMLEEKDIIVSVAIDRFIEAVNRGYKFTESEEMKNAVKKYQEDNNSLLQFVSECCEKTTHSKGLKRNEFCEYYRKWCVINKMSTEKDKDIGNQLKEYFSIEAKKTNGFFKYPLKLTDEKSQEFDSANYALKVMHDEYLKKY